MKDITALIWFNRSSQDYEFTTLTAFEQHMEQLGASREDILYAFDDRMAKLGPKIVTELRRAQELNQGLQLKTA